jgi:hypothetical protein
LYLYRLRAYLLLQRVNHLAQPLHHLTVPLRLLIQLLVVVHLGSRLLVRIEVLRVLRCDGVKDQVLAAQVWLQSQLRLQREGPWQFQRAQIDLRGPVRRLLAIGGKGLGQSRGGYRRLRAL